jgi:hypothetical protein
MNEVKKEMFRCIQCGEGFEGDSIHTCNTEKVRMTRQEFMDTFYPRRRAEMPDLVYESIHALVEGQKSQFGMDITGEEIKNQTRIKFIQALERVKNEVMAILCDIDRVDLSDLITEVQ